MINNFGFGILVTAKDMASAQMAHVESSFNRVGTASDVMAAKFAAAKATMVAGLGMMAVGAAALLPLGVGVHEALGAGTAEVSTLVDVATTDMDLLRQGVVDLSVAYGTVPREQVTALYQVISSGAATAADGVVDAAQAMEVLDVANKLAIGGVTDVKTAVDGLTGILGAYGLEAESVMDISDAMFVAMRAGRTKIGELSAEIGKVAPLAGQVGVSFEDMLAVLAAVTTTGASTTLSATGLNAAMMDIIDPTDKAIAEAGRLELAWGRDALEAKGLTGFFQDLMAVMGPTGDVMLSMAANTEITDEQFQSMAESTQGAGADLIKLFPKARALRFMMALTGGAAETFGMIVDQMGEKAGQTGVAFDKMADLLTFKLRVAVAIVRGVFIGLGRHAFAPLIIVVDALNSVLMAIYEMFLKYPSIGKVIATVLGVFGTLIFTFGTYLTVVGLARMASLWFASAGLGGIVGAAWPIVKVLTLIAGAVALLVAAYQHNFLGLRDALKPTVEVITSWLVDLRDVFQAAITFLTGGEISKSLAESLVTRDLDEVVVVWTNIFFAVKGAVLGFWDVVSWVGRRLAEVFGFIAYVLSWAFTSVLDLIGKLIPGLVDMSGEVTGQTDKFIAWGDAIGKAIAVVVIFKAAVLAWGVITGTIYAVTTAIRFMTGAIWAMNLAWLANPAVWIALAVIAVLALLIYYWDDVMVVIKSGWDEVKAYVLGGWAEISEEGKPMIVSLTDMIIKGVWDLTKSTYEAMWLGLGLIGYLVKTGFVWLGNWLYEVALPAIVQWSKDVWEAVKEAWFAGIVDLTATLTDFWADLTSDFKLDWSVVLPETVIPEVTTPRPTTGFFEDLSTFWGELFPYLQHGGEVTRPGPVSAIMHQGEVVMSTSTTRAIADFADRVAGAERGGGEDSQLTGTTVTVAPGGVVIQFPGVSSVKEVDVESLVDRLYDALEEKGRSDKTRQFKAGEGFAGAYV